MNRPEKMLRQSVYVATLHSGRGLPNLECLATLAKEDPEFDLSRCYLKINAYEVVISYVKLVENPNYEEELIYWEKVRKRELVGLIEEKEKEKVMLDEALMKMKKEFDSIKGEE